MPPTGGLQPPGFNFQQQESRAWPSFPTNPSLGQLDTSQQGPYHGGPTRELQSEHPQGYNRSTSYQDQSMPLWHGNRLPSVAEAPSQRE